MSSPIQRHERKPLRARGFDYATPGLYMVTICVHHMECRFGSVIDGQVRLNQAGALVDRHWRSLPERFPVVELDAYVIMPNHLHGILLIRPNNDGPGQSLSTIVGAFKSLVMFDYAKGVREKRLSPFDRSLWLRGFQDQIVRDDRMLDTLRTYIDGNPGRWQDKYGDA